MHHWVILQVEAVRGLVLPLHDADEAAEELLVLLLNFHRLPITIALVDGRESTTIVE